MKLPYFILLSNIFLLSFCQSVSPTTPTVSPTKTPSAITPSSTATNTPQPSATVTSTLTPTLEVTRVFFRAQEEIQELQDWLVNAYQEGLDTTEVERELIENGWQKESVSQYVLDYWVSDPDQFLEIDLDGDGKEEWVLTIFTHWDNCQFAERNEAYGYGGELWIINDSGLVLSIYPTAEHSFWNAMIPITITDMTGDGFPDIVTKSVGCSAHTSFAIYHIVSGHFGDIENVVNLETPHYQNIFVLRHLNNTPNEDINENGIAISNPDEQLLDKDEDGISDLVIYGGNFNSVGAGPARIHTEVWSWDGSNISLKDFIPDQARNRIDILLDANTAFALGSITEANSKYEEAYTNTMGLPTLGVADFENLNTEIKQYAAFRLVYVNLLGDNQELASNWANLFQRTYPNSSLTDLIHQLFIVSSSNLESTCKNEIQQLVEGGHDFKLLPDLGYAMPNLGFQSLCFH